jgi:AAHS family 4-hydroxybenzoate transporter-like MFS transporter
MGEAGADRRGDREGLGRVTAKVDDKPQLDEGKWSTYQKLVTALAALAVIFDGCDIQILGVAIPSMMREWHVARGVFGGVLALGLAGMAMGSPLAGYCGDRFGRRPSIIGCVALFGVATLATAFVHGVLGVTILRFVTGLGVGGALPNASALVAELAPSRRRAMAVKLTIVCVPLGGMLAGVIAAQIIPSYGWRTLYIVLGAAPLLFASILWMLLPESPAFKRWQGASYLRSLFSAELVRDTSGIWWAFFFCLASIYLIFGWLPTLLTSQGFDISTASSGVATYNFGGVLGVLIWTALMTVTGSRVPMLLGALGAAVSAVAIAFIPVHSKHASLMLWTIGLNGLMANAVQTSMFALAAHVYPARIRASGIAYATTIGRTGALISSFIGAYLIQAGRGVYWNVVAVAMLLAFAGLAWVKHHIPSGVLISE